MTRYAFCPVCGDPYAPTERIADQSLLECRSCGFRFWQNSKPAVAALVTRIRDGRPQILLTRRGVQPFKGSWDLPGGFLFNGEKPETGLTRELREELGVRAVRPRLVSLGIDEYPSEEVAEEARFVLTVYFVCGIEPEESPAAADDVTEVRWFPLEAPPSDMPFSSNVQALRELSLALDAERSEG